MNELWGDALGYSFSEVGDNAATMEIPIYIILDEAQVWYPSNVTLDSAKQQVSLFWFDIKYRVRPGLELASYLDEPCYDDPNIPIAKPSAVVHLLCFAGYGEANLGSAATPLWPTHIHGRTQSDSCRLDYTSFGWIAAGHVSTPRRHSETCWCSSCSYTVTPDMPELYT